MRDILWLVDLILSAKPFCTFMKYSQNIVKVHFYLLIGPTSISVVNLDRIKVLSLVTFVPMAFLKWAQYSIASTAIKLFNASDTDIRHDLVDVVYNNDRLPGRGKFIDKSPLKIGCQSLPYRIGPTFATIAFDWVGCNLSDDALRREPKKQFFKYYVDKP
jgi:hypothetical protein